MKKENDYIFVLKALKDIPFCVGKRLLADFLRGNSSNKSIKKNRLYELSSFGTLAYEKEEIYDVLQDLAFNGLVREKTLNGNRFLKVLELSEKGMDEIESPRMYRQRAEIKSSYEDTVISEKDREAFEGFGDFLDGFNDEQKKAIISPGKEILCIAGAGSGKTTVLTKRIEFLVRFRSASPEKILAITFTRKARREMMKRLSEKTFLSGVMVETFNSFCEKILRRHYDAAYGRPVRVISYNDKFSIAAKALAKLGIDLKEGIYTYFSRQQRAGKTDEQLAAIFVNDCFFIRDYFKFKGRKIEREAFLAYNREHEKSAGLVFSVCSFIDSYMEENGLRDFADQLIDSIRLFESHKELIPGFEHVLVDEYQDVNSTQIRILDILRPENLFCVGDPRQSIYGWRGSDIRYILNFRDKFPGSEIVTLKKNYRSTSHIVKLTNMAISFMGLPDINSEINGEKDIRLVSFDSEEAEFEFVAQAIMESKEKGGEIFVLARTNRQLNELSYLLRQRGIKHVVRSDEIKKSIKSGEDDVTLATIHAIKGLEAKVVFVIGCNSFNFPCKGSEHPVVEMVKVEEYDKADEERRLFYVAMTRAKKSLYLTYFGSRATDFITKDMYELIEGESRQKRFSLGKSNEIIKELKLWRQGLAESLGITAEMVLDDKAIFDIAFKLPSGIEGLGSVAGLDKAKIEEFGHEIIDIVKRSAG